MSLACIRFVTTDPLFRHGIINLDRKLDFLTAKSVRWGNANSFNDTLRSQHLDNPQNEAKLIGFLKAYASQQDLKPINDATETGLFEAIRTGNAKLEPWSATSDHIVVSLMESLSFSEMLERQESIHDNFEGTFQWIYHPPRDVDRPWDSFSTWLTEGRGVYWITGKAGSGKSTLMRMLHQSQRTDELLRIWCGPSSLVTASFFFWNSGSKMQMSQDGLLRSILLQIIEQRLQQSNCDTLREKLVVFAIMVSSLKGVHFKDLLQLFRFIIEDNSSLIKFFLILDGLDEFDGDKSELISLIHTLGMYDHVKVCVSSRPWVVFEDGFRQQPSLVLQHLTHHDVLLYVKEKLTREPSFRELSWADPQNASELIRSITKKASGVFLWVVLAVNSLIKGLADGDRVRDLDARLEEIPEELEELFRKMLHGLEGRYFQDAARLFQIHRATRWSGFDRQLKAKLPLLVYSFADEHGADHDATSKWPPRALTEKERFMTAVSMKRRINSRCNGLLEIDEPINNNGETWRAKYRQLDRLISEAEAGDLSVLPTLYSYGHNLARSNVQYLHRTVKDYLEDPDIWRSIESAAPTEGKDYWILSLCLAFTMLWKNGDEEDLKIHGPPLLKLQPPSRMSSGLPLGMPSGFQSEHTTMPPTLIRSDKDRRQNSRMMLETCVDLGTSFLPGSPDTSTRLLDAIGAAIFDGDMAKAECNRHDVLSSVIWKHDSLGFVFENFLALAVHSNLFEYVDAKISRLPRDDQVATASRLLIVAVLKCFNWFQPQAVSMENPSISKGFCGADQKPDHAPMPFEITERELKLLSQEETASNLSFHMTQVLMNHGADPDFQAYGMSARQILELRRVELEHSVNFRHIKRCFDSKRGITGCFTRRAKSVFHKRN